MPTFKNNTNRLVEYTAWVRGVSFEPRKLLVSFPAGEEKALSFWVPHVQLGLSLVDANFPPVPNEILANGTFPLTAEATRTFQIAPCDRYSVDLIAQSGRFALFLGSGSLGVEVSATHPTAFRYAGVLDWEHAPHISVVGVEDGEFTLSAEVWRGHLGGCGGGFGPRAKGVEPCP
jgi:hypothetical protein